MRRILIARDVGERIAEVDFVGEQVSESGDDLVVTVGVVVFDRRAIGMSPGRLNAMVIERAADKHHGEATEFVGSVADGLVLDHP